ncbi:hypothetical protein QFZ99_003261 [Paraburkholderia atlantica]
MAAAFHGRQQLLAERIGVGCERVEHERQIVHAGHDFQHLRPLARGFSGSPYALLALQRGGRGRFADERGIAEWKDSWLAHVWAARIESENEADGATRGRRSGMESATIGEYIINKISTIYQ